MGWNRLLLYRMTNILKSNNNNNKNRAEPINVSKCLLIKIAAALDIIYTNSNIDRNVTNARGLVSG